MRSGKGGVQVSGNGGRTRGVAVSVGVPGTIYGTGSPPGPGAAAEDARSQGRRAKELRIMNPGNSQIIEIIGEIAGTLCRRKP